MQDKVDKFAEKRIRRGKTQKDRANGAHAQNAGNKTARVSWQQGGPNAEFPAYSCNGKKNKRAP